MSIKTLLCRTFILALSLSVPPVMVACGGSEPEEPRQDAEPEKPSLPEMGRLADILWHQTSCRELDGKRVDALRNMQVYADMCPNTTFKTYYATTDPAACLRMESNSMLGFHKSALDKILEEVPKEKVENGHIAVWLLYNMGYIVKTPSHCFGVDIKHKDAVKVAPLIEFLCVTHAHEDHYTSALVEEMGRTGKPVYSNFIENGHKVGDEASFSPVDGIRINVLLVDHNATTPAFVNTYEIDCGKDTGNKVIYHSGDAYNHKQLKTAAKPHIFIPHLAVGLDMDAAIEKLQPEYVLLSHVLEMDHPIEKWRWSYQYGMDVINKLSYRQVYMPVWGEKMVY